MASILFLQDLGLSRGEAERMLRSEGCAHELVWPGDRISKAKKRDVEIVVASQHNIGKRQLDALENLKMVSLAFTGVDEVEQKYCRRRKLHVFYVPGYSTDSVAELTVFLAGELLRTLSGAIPAMHRGNWNSATKLAVRRRPQRELRGMTVGILGTGTIGMAAARLFHAFGCPLIGWTKHPEHHPQFERLGGTFVRTKEQVFRQADIVSVHLALTPRTRHVVNMRRLRLMGSDSILINTARTFLVHPQALAKWLRSNPDKGAALDVTKKDQLESVFAGIDNLVLTPHLGCQTQEASSELARVALANVGRFLKPRMENQLLPK